MAFYDGWLRREGDENYQRYHDQMNLATSTATTTITTDNTSTDYVVMNTDGNGALYVNNRSWFAHNDEIGSPVKWSAPKPKRFIDQLRQEIADWHGDCLAA